MAILSKQNETRLLIAGALLIGYTIYKANNAVEGVKEVFTKSLNPVDDENIINKGVSKIVATVTGNEHKNLGSYMFCLLNSDAIICNPELLQSAHRNNVSFYGENAEGEQIINPQLIALYEQEKGFFEEDVL